jgi:hypothetical protein
MGIKDFFKKVGRGIKNVAGKVWGGIKKGAQFVGKVAKPIINIAKPVLNTLSMLPGKLGMIGKIGSAGAEFAKNIVDRIPNEDARNKLNNVIDRGKEAVDNVQNKAQGVAGKVKPWADMGLGLINNHPPIPKRPM